MAISAPYTNGAVLTNTGAIQVTSQSKVDNLNAEKLQGKIPSDFAQLGNDFGLTQSATGAITASGISIANTNVNQTYDKNSIIKIGKIVIKPNSNGDGLLVGFEQ